MLLKRKLFKKKQLILKHIYKKNELKNIILNSLLRNHYNHYIFRLSFTVKDRIKNSNTFFKSRQKLICLYSLDKKIPSRHYNLSRFYLNSRLNSIKINNTY